MEETQIHIHEGVGGSANIKYRDGTRTMIGSYDADFPHINIKYLKEDYTIIIKKIKESI